MTKPLTAADVTFELIVRPESLPVRGNAMCSGDDATDREAEDWILGRLDRGDVWAWADVEVRATWNGLSESDYLGCCSYENAAAFTADAYYEDMKATALERLNARVTELGVAIETKWRDRAYAK